MSAYIIIYNAYVRFFEIANMSLFDDPTALPPYLKTIYHLLPSFVCSYYIYNLHFLKKYDFILFYLFFHKFITLYYNFKSNYRTSYKNSYNFFLAGIFFF